MATATQTQQQYRRFSGVERFEHIVLLLTFTGLALTGLPQKFATEAWANAMIALMGGIETVRIIHRIMATILMVEAIYHGGIITYKLFVLGRRATMIPDLKDAKDVRDWILFNLGFKQEHPELPRYNFGEKAEYLAVIWGTIIMAITGFMMWNPIATAALLPGEWIPAARAAHGAEAILAVLSILTWHMYNVHIKRFNRSMFTGKMPREVMHEEHGAELAALDRGEKPYEFPPEIQIVLGRRFWPVAIAIATVLLLALVWFITFEDTAIATVPRQRIEVDVPVSVSGDIGDPALGAELWGTLNCQACHGDQGQGDPRLFAATIAGTQLSFEDFAATVRRGPADMPAYGPAQLEDEQLAHLWAWLRSLDPPAEVSDAAGD
ncbi:MAG: c-type cytochrome [Anaerolineae bacterium]|nr:c-type cytochrome [Anaerolineae bacterium]